MKLSTNAHSVFSLNYHLIMCIKYRNKILTDIISMRLKEIFERIAIDYNIGLTEWEHDCDHVHCLFSAHPKSALSKFINAYKSASSRLIKKEFPEIRDKRTNLDCYQIESKSPCLLKHLVVQDLFGTSY